MRESGYNHTLGAIICQMLADGKTLIAVCESLGLAKTTVLRWRDSDEGPGFADLYARARLKGYEVMADEVMHIANTQQEGVITKMSEQGLEVTRKDMIDHRRLQVDTRKWMLSKALPKVYGDKLALEASGPGGGPINLAVTLTDAELTAIAAAGLPGPDK